MLAKLVGGKEAEEQSRATRFALEELGGATALGKEAKRIPLSSREVFFDHRHFLTRPGATQNERVWRVEPRTGSNAYLASPRLVLCSAPRGSAPCSSDLAYAAWPSSMAPALISPPFEPRAESALG